MENGYGDVINSVIDIFDSVICEFFEGLETLFVNCFSCVKIVYKNKGCKGVLFPFEKKAGKYIRIVVFGFFYERNFLKFIFKTKLYKFFERWLFLFEKLVFVNNL